MTDLIWKEAPLRKRHDRTAFDCGDADLNLYLHRYARQNHESAKCFVASPTRESARVLGFFRSSCRPCAAMFRASASFFPNSARRGWQGTSPAITMDMLRNR